MAAQFKAEYAAQRQAQVAAKAAAAAAPPAYAAAAAAAPAGDDDMFWDYGQSSATPVAPQTLVCHSPDRCPCAAPQAGQSILVVSGASRPRGCNLSTVGRLMMFAIGLVALRWRAAAADSAWE